MTLKPYNHLVATIDFTKPVSIEVFLRDLFIGIPVPLIIFVAHAMGYNFKEDSIRRLIGGGGRSSSIRRVISEKHPDVNLNFNDFGSNFDAVLLPLLESICKSIPIGYSPLFCACLYLPRYPTIIEYLYGCISCADIYIARYFYVTEEKRYIYHRKTDVKPVVEAIIQEADPLRQWVHWVEEMLKLEGGKGSMARAMRGELSSNNYIQPPLLDSDYSTFSRLRKKSGLGIKSIERMMNLVTSISNETRQRHAYIALIFSYTMTYIKRTELWKDIATPEGSQKIAFERYRQDAENAFAEYHAHLDQGGRLYRLD